MGFLDPETLFSRKWGFGELRGKRLAFKENVLRLLSNFLRFLEAALARRQSPGAFLGTTKETKTPSLAPSGPTF